MRRAALATAIAVLVLPAATLSADRDVPSPGNQYDPAIAFDGTNYFVVWRDDNTVSDIHGARVTQEGAVLDADSIPISHGFSSSPAVAFDGENYLVVWRSTVGSVNSIYGTRVTPNGQLLDPNGIVISTPAATEPAIAFDGTNYLVVWRDNRTGAWRIRGARITPEGTVLDPDSFPISAPTIDQRQSPSVAFGGTHYLVTWDQFSGGPNDIYGARVATDGTVLDQNGIAISTAAFGQESSTIAYDGVNFLVAWSDQRTTAAAPDIFGARVSAAGTVLDPAGIVIAQRPAIQSEPALAFGGENYLAAWYDGIYPLADGDVYGARVSPDGSVLDPSAFAVSVSFNGQRSPAIAFGGENYFVVWEDGRTQEVFDIQGSRVTPDGTVLDPGGIVISRSTTGPPPPPPGPPPPPAPPPPPPIEPPPPPPPPPPPHRPRRLRHLAHRRHHRHRPHPRLHPDHRRLHHLRHHLRPHRRLHRHLPAGAASSPGWSACD